jgi:hypothetical protein
MEGSGKRTVVDKLELVGIPFNHPLQSFGRSNPWFQTFSKKFEKSFSV